MRSVAWLFLGIALGCDGGEKLDESDESQTPPQGADLVEAWIADGFYLDWACEADAHTARPPSPHGANRICSNDLLSGHGAGEYPVGAASVKELIADDLVTIVGFAVALHPQAGTDAGDWYWYERVPLDSAAPHDAEGIVADGPGIRGPANAICVGCHVAAGTDADHSGHDFVYTQVP